MQVGSEQHSTAEFFKTGSKYTVIIRQKTQGSRLKRLVAISPRRLACLYFAVAALVVAGLSYEFLLLYRAHNTLADSRPSETDNELHVVTRISLNTYYESDNGPTGFEYALLHEFAESLDKKLVVHTAESLGELLDLVASKRVDFASAGLSPTLERKQRFLFSKPYLHDQPIIVYKVGQHRPRSYRDLVGKDLVAIANSSHSALLGEIRADIPELAWRELENVNFHELLKWVEDGEVDYTVIDASEFALHRAAFPTLKRALDLGSEQQISWLFAKTRNGKAWRKQADLFIESMHSNGTLAQLEERYFGQARHVSQVAANEFAKSIRKRLPKYIDNIKLAADELGMDWRLLAAISYQESRWNPRAKSPTGVRGMMMLTLPTAKELGIANRLDVDQSLAGGARYYQRLKDQLPARIEEPDRSWLALAAYNVGSGHLEDARRITEGRGGDPDSWFHVKESLPLLSDPAWYAETRYGYARGHEPVRYVQQVRHYYNVLRWHDLSRLSNREIANHNRALTETLGASTPQVFPPLSTGGLEQQLGGEPSSEELISEVLLEGEADMESIDTLQQPESVEPQFGLLENENQQPLETLSQPDTSISAL